MINVAVIGNPNSGKTTLFNGLTGSKQHVGNWPGVTVEKKEGSFLYEGESINLIDLPGIYSLSAFSEDEKVARDYLLSGEPDLVINVLDSTNIERNLYLTTNLVEMKVPVLMVLNMSDLAEKNGTTFDMKLLQELMDMPVVAVDATRKEDIARLKRKIFEERSLSHISTSSVKYPNEIEDILKEWAVKLDVFAGTINADSRWVAIKLLENDMWLRERVISGGYLEASEIKEKNVFVEKILKETADEVIANYKYGFIQSLAKQVIRRREERESLTDKIDKVVMHKFFGIPVFLVIMYLVFWVTMNIGGAFIDFFDILFGSVFVDGLGALLGRLHTPLWLQAIVANGIGAGIRTVSTFIPIVFTMFFMLSLLEDSGYMARAAFVMDRFMRLLGLPGKAFVPMIVGFGCTVPAVMATRTLESRKDRLLTIFMTPLMSCGARLPVYALFSAAFFSASKGNAVFSLYLVGIVLAVLTGLLLKKTFLKGEVSHFIMELPVYHIPRMKHILLHTWNRMRIFVFRAGVFIIIAVSILGFFNTIGIDGSLGNEENGRSVLATVGKTITPVFEPMGIEKENWPASVALFTGIFAKEAVVGTLGSLYSQMDSGSQEAADVRSHDFWGGVVAAFASIPENLAGVLKELADPLGLNLIRGDENSVAEELDTGEAVFISMRKYFSRGPLQAYSYLLFVLIYFPCVAALGAIFREVGRKYSLLIISYLTILAWSVATLFYQLTVGHQLLWIAVPLGVLGAIIGGMAYFSSRKKSPEKIIASGELP